MGGQCTYVIVVINPYSDKRAMYKIVATHSQNNHAMLQENTPLIGSVDFKTYKYYKFNLIEDDSQILNVTFEISPIHGDSDIFISHNDSV